MFNDLWGKPRADKKSQEKQTKEVKQKNDFNSKMQNVLDPYAPMKQYGQKFKKAIKFALAGGAIIFLSTSILFSFLAVVKEKHMMFVKCNDGIELTKIDNVFAVTIPQLGITNKKSNCIQHNKKTLVCGPYHSPDNSFILYYYTFDKNLTGYAISKMLIKLENANTSLETTCENNNLQYDKLDNACVYNFNPPISCSAQRGLPK